MTYSYEIYSIDTGAFGYNVLADGVAYIKQDTAPGVSGFVPMTEDEARGYAEADVAALTPAVAD